MSEQIVTYNGEQVTLASVRYGGRAVYDQTDRTHQGFSLIFRVSGIVYGTTQAGFATKLGTIKDAFSRSRRHFLWTVGSTTIFSITGSGQDSQTVAGAIVDRRYGPKVRGMEVEQIVNSYSARITFEVECHIAGANAGNLEEFWWEFSFDYDRNFTCTRNITGVMRLAAPSDAALTFLTSGTYWPAIPRGFFRDSIQHTTSADGLQVRFTIIDRQIWRTLPKPLTEGYASFHIETQGAMMFKSLQCSFSAPINVNKQIIMQFILQLIRARFPRMFNAQSLNPDPPPSGQFGEFITSFSITNHEFENKMECSITTRSSAPAILKNAVTAEKVMDIDFLGLGLDDVKNIAPPAGDGWTASDGESHDEGITGTALLLPGVSYPFDVQNSANVPSVNPDTDQESVPATTGNTGYNQQGEAFDSATHNPEASDEHNAYPYTFFMEHYQYILDYRKVVLPVMKASTDTAAVTDVVQQLGNPVLRILQIGRARRLNHPVGIPEPVPMEYGMGAHIESREIRTTAPQILSDGRSLEYECSWNYCITVPQAHNITDYNYTPSDQDVPLGMPLNPQLDFTYDASVVVPGIISPNKVITEDGTYT